MTSGGASPAPHDPRSLAGSAVCRELSDRYLCANTTRLVALRAGFDAQETAEIALSAAELASIAVRHGRRGVLEIFVLRGTGVGIELRCADEGPGFTDVDGALLDGWSRGRPKLPEDTTRDGLGTGLGAIRRLMDELVIESGPGGAVVTARRWARPRRR